MINIKEESQLHFLSSGLICGLWFHMIPMQTGSTVFSARDPLHQHQQAATVYTVNDLLCLSIESSFHLH